MMTEALQQQPWHNWQEPWQFAKPFIERAIKYQDLYTIDDVEGKIANGSFQLWVGNVSATITEIQEFPQKRIMNVLFCGGDLSEIIEMEKSFIHFAKLNGCTRLYGGGRKAWVRKLKQLTPGWETDYLIKKEI